MNITMVNFTKIVFPFDETYIQKINYNNLTTIIYEFLFLRSFTKLNEQMK